MMFVYHVCPVDIHASLRERGRTRGDAPSEVPLRRTCKTRPDEVAPAGYGLDTRTSATERGIASSIAHFLLSRL